MDEKVNNALEQAYERSLCAGSSKDSCAVNFNAGGQSWLYGR
jgi:ribosome modulation factor